MTSFSDEDLKLLKEGLVRGQYASFMEVGLPALLARLEAAEYVISRLRECDGKHPTSEDDDEYCDSCGNVGWYCNSWIGPAISDWRKACGK